MSLLLYHRVARHYLFFNYRNWNILERLLHKSYRSWVRRLAGVAGVACTDIAHTIPATLSVVVWPIFRILCFCCEPYTLFWIIILCTSIGTLKPSHTHSAFDQKGGTREGEAREIYAATTNNYEITVILLLIINVYFSLLRFLQFDTSLCVSVRLRNRHKAHRGCFTPARPFEWVLRDEKQRKTPEETTTQWAKK